MKVFIGFLSRGTPKDTFHPKNSNMIWFHCLFIQKMVKIHFLATFFRLKLAASTKFRDIITPNCFWNICWYVNNNKNKIHGNSWKQKCVMAIYLLEMHRKTAPCIGQAILTQLGKNAVTFDLSLELSCSNDSNKWPQYKIWIRNTYFHFSCTLGSG